MKHFIIWEDASVVNKYKVTAESEERAKEMVIEGEIAPDEQDFKEFEIVEVIELDSE